MKRIRVIHLARVLRVLILAVLAVRWLTRDRLSSVNRYALWLVVLFAFSYRVFVRKEV